MANLASDHPGKTCPGERSTDTCCEQQFPADSLWPPSPRRHLDVVSTVQGANWDGTLCVGGFRKDIKGKRLRWGTVALARIVHSWMVCHLEGSFVRTVRVSWGERRAGLAKTGSIRCNSRGRPGRRSRENRPEPGRTSRRRDGELAGRAPDCYRFAMAPAGLALDALDAASRRTWHDCFPPRRDTESRVMAAPPSAPWQQRSGTVGGRVGATRNALHQAPPHR